MNLRSTLRRLAAAAILSAAGSTLAAPAATAAPAAGTSASADAGPAAATEARWIPTWYAAPAPTARPTAELDDRTIREIVHTSVGGRRVRIELSNAYGTSPLDIDGAYVAVRVAGATAGPGVRVRFSGADDATVAPGATITSDAVALDVAPQSDLAVSVYVRHAVASTGHLQQRSAVYYAQGNVAERAGIATVEPPKEIGGSWLFLSRVEVSGTTARRVIVAFGDSITDGAGVVADQAGTWPDRLEDRLVRAHRDIAVVNAAITGNRVTLPPQWPPFGERGLSRFDRDVLQQPGLAAVVILIGINDIGQGTMGHGDVATPEAVERALSRLVARAHAKGARAYLGTLTPFRGTTYWSDLDPKERLRQAINGWIRQQKVADGVVDFDRALADPRDPRRMRPEDDSGDHLHPNARGAAALADAVPLSWFR